MHATVMEINSEDKTQIIPPEELERRRRQIRLDAGIVHSETDLESMNQGAEAMDLSGPSAQISRSSLLTQELFSDPDPRPVSQFPDADRFVQPETPAIIRRAEAVTPQCPQDFNRLPVGNPFTANPFKAVFGSVNKAASLSQLFQPTQGFSQGAVAGMLFETPLRPTNVAGAQDTPFPGAITPPLGEPSPAPPPVSSAVLENAAPAKKYVSMAESQERRRQYKSRPGRSLDASPTNKEDMHWDDEFERETSVERAYKRRRLDNRPFKPLLALQVTASAPTSPAPRLRNHASLGKPMSPLSPRSQQDDAADSGAHGDWTSSLAHPPFASLSPVLLVARSSGNNCLQESSQLGRPQWEDEAGVSLHVADSQPLPHQTDLVREKSHAHWEVKSLSQNLAGKARRSPCPVPSIRQHDELHVPYERPSPSPVTAEDVHHSNATHIQEDEPVEVRIHSRKSSRLAGKTQTASTAPSPSTTYLGKKPRVPFSLLDQNSGTSPVIVPDTLKKPKASVPEIMDTDGLSEAGRQSVEIKLTNEEDDGVIRCEALIGAFDCTASPGQLNVGQTYTGSLAPPSAMDLEPNIADDVMSQVKTFGSLRGSTTPEPEIPTLKHYGLPVAEEDAAFAAISALPDLESPIRRFPSRASRHGISRRPPIVAYDDQDELGVFGQEPVLSPSKKQLRHRSLTPGSAPSAMACISQLAARSGELPSQQPDSNYAPVASSLRKSGHQDDSVGDPFAAPDQIHNRVLAKFRDRTARWWAAIMTGVNDQGALRIKFDDGTCDTVDSHSVRQLRFNKGDKVKIDVTGQKNQVYSVIGLVNQITTDELAADKLCDVRGWTTLRLMPVTRRSTSNISSALDERFARLDDISLIYLSDRLFQSFARTHPPVPLTELGEQLALKAPDATLPTPSTSPYSSGAMISQASSVDGEATGIFSNMGFCLSLSDEIGDKRALIEKIIKNEGGMIIDTDFQGLFEQGTRSTQESNAIAQRVSKESRSIAYPIHQPSFMSLRQEYASLKFVCLIVERASRKPKYLQALALGIPCVFYNWILHSDSASKLRPWQCYLLSAGVSKVLGDLEKSQVLNNWSAPDMTFGRALMQRDMTLQGIHVLFIFANQKDKSSREEMLFIARAMGADSANDVKTMKAAKIVAEDFPSCHFYVSSMALKKARKYNQIDGKRKRAPSVSDDGHSEGDFKIVDDEWLKQSLILGRLVDLD